jgi:ribosomal protein S11
MQKQVKKNVIEKPINTAILYTKNLKKVSVGLKKTLKSNKFLNKKDVKTAKITKEVLYNSISGKPFRTYHIKENSKIKKLNIRIVPNNVFCTLKDIETNNIIKSVSGGSYKLKISKKGLRVYSNQVISNFLNDIKDIYLKSLVVVITAPKNVKKQILVLIKKICDKKVKKKFLLVELTTNKIFNGCRPRKKIRKKRQGLRLFK